MSRPSSIVASLAIAASVLFSPLVLAQPATPDRQSAITVERTGPNQSPVKGRAGTAPVVVQLGTALELVRFAEENESALAMLTAVQMIRQIQLAEDPERFAERKTEELPADAPAARRPSTKDEARTSVDPLDTTALLTKAKEWAKEDSALLALIESELAKPAIQPEGTMGRVGGPLLMRAVKLPARSTHTYSISFRGGEEAVILVEGDGDTDLDLFVYDENDNLVGSDTDRTDLCLVRWTPRWTGKFTVRVVNLGYVYNVYSMVTN